MTTLQKDIITLLFNNHTVAAYRDGTCRLRDENSNPVLKFSQNTLRVLKPFLRKNKSGLFLLDKNAVRQERNSTWIKQFYKNQIKSACMPVDMVPEQGIIKLQPTGPEYFVQEHYSDTGETKIKLLGNSTTLSFINYGTRVIYLNKKFNP